jgi:hypothetical protein
MIVEESEWLVRGERRRSLIISNSLREKGSRGDMSLKEYLQRGLAFRGVAGLEQLGDFGTGTRKGFISWREEGEGPSII